MGSKPPLARAKSTALSGRLTCQCRNVRCLRGNRREIRDLRLDPTKIATAAKCQRWELPEHRAPTVSSAKHWYGSSVDQPKIQCVLSG